MKWTLLFFLFLGVCVKGLAQKEATNWYFGEKAGLTFSNGRPEVLTNGSMQASEGSATISDSKTGELLFYTNGKQVWNRQHQVMPNGNDLMSDVSSTQSALIVPFPGHPQQYYLFAVNSFRPLDLTTLPGLTYSIVNMNLEGGLGNVEPATKNTRLLTSTTEKLTAVRHVNGKDYWVITHGWANNEFYIYLLNEMGVSEPKISRIGSMYAGGISGHAAGYLKASPNGKKLAAASSSEGAPVLPIEVFDFDASTGTISNQVSLGVPEIPIHYGVSFSPDNSKLYISGLTVTQFDLSLPTTQDIINSQVQITPLPSTGRVQSLQLGPDGHLYNNVDQNTFYVINYPNKAGMACAPELVEFDFKGGRSVVGLPNFMQHYFNGLEPSGTSSICSPEEAITIFPNPTEKSFKIRVNSDCYQVNQVSIFNAIGQQIGSLQIDEVSGEIDISSLAAGLYVLQITTSKEEIIKKFIKI